MSLDELAVEVFTLKALSDRTRLRLVHLLHHKEQCVCNLVQALELPQPTVSRHLAFLRKAGLVTVRKQANWMYYTLREPENDFHRKLLESLQSFFANNSELAEDMNRLKTSECR